MANELNIDQLKFAREIGATHHRNGIDFYKDLNYDLNIRAHRYNKGKNKWGLCSGVWSVNDSDITTEIDFSPLDDYYADKELDIAATGGEVDMVNHPPHYQSDNGIECIDAIRAALGKEGFIAYCRGNAMKYTWRDKQNNAEDYRKAAWYLEKAAQE